MTEIRLEVSTYRVARAEARALSMQVTAIKEQITPANGDDDVGRQMALLVTGALAVELYFKAFMICARGGRVTQGHDLNGLYKEFPPFLKSSFEAEYARLIASEPPTYRISAFQISPNAPPPPAGDCPPYRFDSFSSSITSLARAFVTYRYFFEEIGHDR